MCDICHKDHFIAFRNEVGIYNKLNGLLENMHKIINEANISYGHSLLLNPSDGIQILLNLADKLLVLLQTRKTNSPISAQLIPSIPISNIVPSQICLCSCTNKVIIHKIPTFTPIEISIEKNVDGFVVSITHANVHGVVCDSWTKTVDENDTCCKLREFCMFIEMEQIRVLEYLQLLDDYEKLIK